jgi:hypothetical protein
MSDSDMTTPEYWSEMERRLLHKPPAGAGISGEVYDADSGNSRVIFSPRKERDPVDHGRHIFSAPPSRSVPTSDGRRYSESITLSAAQKEHCRIANCSEKEYASQLRELNRRKSLGDYS